MNLPPRLDEALRRLSAALDQLDAAAARRVRADEVRTNLEDELAVMQDDRSRLAVDLDAAMARSRALERASAQVRERLTKTAVRLRDVLGQSEASAGASRDPGATDPQDSPQDSPNAGRAA